MGVKPVEGKPAIKFKPESGVKPVVLKASKKDDVGFEKEDPAFGVNKAWVALRLEVVVIDFNGK